MNSVFGNDDPFENGWASEPAALFRLASGPPQIPALKVPPQYHALGDRLRPHVTTVSDLDTRVFQPLVAHGLLSPFQSSRIIDLLYDHSLLPVGAESNFFYMLGLLALELSVPGLADYVTLQFRLSLGLPEVAREAEAVLLGLLPAARSPPRDSPLHDLSGLAASMSATGLEASSHGGVQPEQTSTPQQALFPDPDLDPLLHDHLALLLDDPDTTAQDAEHVDMAKYVAEIRDRFSAVAQGHDLVRLKEVPEKEGLVFKHINYAITHDLVLGMNGPAGTKKVIRRYSDFVWLLEFLLKKYPFRVIPGLPPKKFTGASPDSQFLQKRRRGLHRFLNQLVKHPVLKQEPIVITFLSVPTDFVSWKRQARVDYSLEFKGEKILTTFISSVWPAIGDETLANWRSAEAGVAKLIDLWTKIIMLVERHERRQQQIAFDNSKFAEILTKFSDANNCVYPHKQADNAVVAALNADDTNALNSLLLSIAGFFNNSATLLVDESYVLNTDVLEKFKIFLDYLYSLQELFERSKRLSVNTIPQLQQRILENEQKHEKLSMNDADIKGSELAKLRQTIINDKQEMFQQLNRDWLIKNCCFEEYVMFQETQYVVSEAWADWCRHRHRFEDKLTGLCDALNSEVASNMPLER